MTKAAPAKPAPPPPAGPAVARPPRAAAAIALVQSASLPNLVQREIERMIVGGELAAGSKLNEVAIAELLGVSRGPVREAFRALEESGLVRFEKNRGVFVREIDVAEADDIYELRALLDDFIGRRAAQGASPEIARELQSRVERMEKAAAKGDVDAYYQANLAFHDRLAELAGNAKLLTIYRRLVLELGLFRRATLAEVGTLRLSAREHRQIVDKIVGGHAAAAGRALQEHALASRERMHRTRLAATAAAPPTTPFPSQSDLAGDRPGPAPTPSPRKTR